MRVRTPSSLPLLVALLVNAVSAGFIGSTISQTCRILSNMLSLDPEAYMDVPEMLRHHGYPVETHQVQTEDGYILVLHRIPHGRNEDYSKVQRRVPVLLNSDIFLTSSQWLLNLPNQSFGYILADAGYDVWLGNHRGNMYSRSHAWIDPENKQFWKFTYDEMGLYDIPAMIDYVIDRTQFDKIHLISYFMGAPPVVIALSSRPEYNAKIRLSTGFTPAMSMNTSRVWMHTYSPLMKPMINLMQTYLHPEVGASSEPVKFFGRLLGKFIPSVLIKQVLLNVAHTDGQKLNASRFGVYASHLPAGSSIYLGKQVIQWVNDGYVRQYDWGRRENLRRYAKAEPSEYPLEQVSAPFLMVMAANDIFITNQDVEYLAQQVQNPVFLNISTQHFSHVHLLLSPYAKEVVYDPIINVMKKYDN